MKAVLPTVVQDDLRIALAELLCTRFCHDITGPVGAVNNGVEFLREEGEELLEQAISLIDDSARQAIARIQFFRNCYGRINFSGEANLEELRGIVLDFFASSKITFDWSPQFTDSQTYSFSRKMGRLMMNMILIASESLIRGGTLSINLNKNEDSKEFTIKAEGPVVKCDETTLSVLRGTIADADLDPRTGQVYMTLLLASELGADISYEAADDHFYMTATRWG